MATKIIIVESPAKTKTIEKFLSNEYKVLSSKGHVRDLATTGKYGLGVDLENNFEPSYVVVAGKKVVLSQLKKETANAKQVLIATDPDREGEAIGWHLVDALELEPNKIKRVVFNEITKEAVLKAIKEPRDLSRDLINSQEARRILDRIIGFRLSSLMKAKTDGKSAGRVQSVALKLIVDKEREIEKFVSEEYWSITAKFNDFDAVLEKYNNKTIKLKDEKSANEVLKKLSNSFKIEDVSEQEKSKKSKMPFITSTFQQTASSKLGISSKKAMMIAQKLYEGIDIGSETVGLITYMRTDSTRLANEFVRETFDHIENKYGESYLGTLRQKKSKNKIQDAHEAIRPTSIKRDPQSVKSYLSPDEYKIYKLIYIRALASLMADAKTKATSVIFDNNNYQFKANGSILVFDGYLKVYQDYEENNDVILPDFAKYHSKIVVANQIEKEQHFTKPPGRYSEAKLIKTLEELGIGRPSTYSKIIDILLQRGYVENQEKAFIPTEIGFEITDKLQETFSNIINVEYTAKMEEDLDKIAEGEIIWHQVLADFYQIFDQLLNKAFSTLEKKAPEQAGRNCPKCEHPLVYRNGKYGKFVGCSNFPECKFIETEEKEEICPCPNCDGKIIEKRTRKGKMFYGCDNFPKCKTAFWDKPINEKCPECSAMLVLKKDKAKCSECSYEA